MKFTNLVLLLALILVTFSLLSAKIVVSDSVSQFRYPRFSSSGFIDWVMEGKSGKLLESKLDIESLKVRLYSRDQTNRQVGSVNSEHCILKTKDEIAHSNSSIEVKGSGFNLTGLDWKYDLNSKSITVRKNCSVEFSESISTIFSTDEINSSTNIESDSLELRINSSSYAFKFNGNVNLRSGAIILSADVLIIELLNNSNELKFSIPSGELSGIKMIKATGAVNYIGYSQQISSESFTLYPQLKRGLFENNTKINIDSAILYGDKISIDQSSVNVSAQGDSRAKFSLNETAYSQRSSPTIIQSDSIKFNKNDDFKNYEFNGTVLLQSEFEIIKSDSLIIETESKVKNSLYTNEEIITRCKASGNVLIENNYFQLSGGQLDYFPTKDKIIVKNSVHYLSPLAKFFTESVVIDNNVIIAESIENQMKVYLPETNELGFQYNDDIADEVYSNDTQLTVMCHFLRIEKDMENFSCLFKDSVQIDYNSVNLTSGSLTMDWVETNMLEQKYSLIKAVAEDSVEMKQGYYYANSDLLEIIPNENRITLIGNANYKDLNGSIYGEIIDYDRLLRQTKVRNVENNKRSRIQFNF
mgnify:CR=1 FL=1